MTGRNYYQQSSAGESFTTTKPGAKEDNVPPPKIAPPVFISVPPAPPVAPTANGPPVAPMRSRGPPPGFGPPRRNVPVRSHSMSIADINRFYGSPPLPRFRPPPPPNPQQPHRVSGAKVEITELGVDSGSENEDELHKKQKPKKHFIHHNNQVNEFFFTKNYFSFIFFKGHCGRFAKQRQCRNGFFTQIQDTRSV